LHGKDLKRKKKILSSCRLTCATNIGLRLSLSINVFAISEVGDLEAMAMSIPFSLSAYNMPLAWGNKDGISRLERHSLNNNHN